MIIDSVSCECVCAGYTSVTPSLAIKLMVACLLSCVCVLVPDGAIHSAELCLVLAGSKVSCLGCVTFKRTVAAVTDCQA